MLNCWCITWPVGFKRLSFIYRYSHRCSVCFLHVNRQMVAWIGCGGMIAWPPWSPDLTPLDFSVWRYVNDRVFVPPLPASLEELWAHIIEVVATIGANMIHRILDEIAYRWDICCMTRGNHIEHLWISVDKMQIYTAFCDIYHDTISFLLSVFYITNLGTSCIFGYFAVRQIGLPYVCKCCEFRLSYEGCQKFATFSRHLFGPMHSVNYSLRLIIVSKYHVHW